MITSYPTRTSDVGILKYSLNTAKCSYSDHFEAVIESTQLHDYGLDSVLASFGPDDGGVLGFQINDCITLKASFECFIKNGKLKVTGHVFDSDLIITFVKTDFLKSQMNIEQERTLLRLKASLAATKTGVWDWDYSNNRLYWDSTMFELFELDQETFSGTFDSFQDLIVPGDLAAMADNIIKVVESGEEFVNTFRIVTPSGLKYIAARGKIDPSRADGIWFTGINWDVTSEVRKNDIIKQQEAKIFASARLSSLGEMAGGIAHEINNPLAIIQAKAEFLKKRLDPQGKDREFLGEGLDKITATCQRIVGIIKGLRSFSRNSENDPFIPVPLKTVVNDVLGLISEKIKMSFIKLDVDIHEDFVVKGRPAQLGQVFMNLISNSYDSIESQEEKWIHIHASTMSKGRLEIRITDSGKGIDGDIQSRIMQPFFTTKEVGKGTGLGLSIAKGIIEDHAGKFWLDSSSPRTCFVIELPYQ